MTILSAPTPMSTISARAAMERARADLAAIAWVVSTGHDDLVGAHSHVYHLSACALHGGLGLEVLDDGPAIGRRVFGDQHEVAEAGQREIRSFGAAHHVVDLLEPGGASRWVRLHA